ncbi:hypothetical protein IFM89_018796 [Coptis chinensis]|uniref:Uncharacterized protein n=1 Tax=Coptis chinensis TaxID=261450 RepID=A0A835IAY5_9MAGN|nr:hypothetical protein IFM89_018796 [Coptis chinensis]
MRMASVVGPNHAKWNTQEEFEPNVPQQRHREVEKDFSQKFRSSKYAFRKRFWRKCRSVEEEAIAKHAHMARIQIIGLRFVENESTAEDKEDPSRKHGRVDSWKKGHERRDGTILASAQTHYEQVEASNKRRKETSAGGEGSVMEVDFDNDELSEVFGPDKGSRTRGISSNKSKKQLQRMSIAKALLRQASSSSNSKLKGEINEMKSSLSNVIAR